MRNSRQRLLCITVIAVALATASCNRNTIYHHYEPTPISGWMRSDTLHFNVAPARQRAVVQRDIELRMAANYPYQQLSLIVEQTTLPSSVRRRDTVSCRLISPEGRIQGHGISLYQYHCPLTDISLNEGDSLSFSIRHDMKRDILPGIANVGIRLTAY